MNPIRVLEIIDRSFLGGGQTALLSLASGLNRDRFQVYAASEGGGPLVDELKKRAVPHVPLKLGRLSGPKAVRGIVAALKETRADILHTHGGIAGFYGRWAAWKAGTPAVVHTLHGIHYLHYRNPLLRQAHICLERLFSRITDAVVFVSEADREEAIRRRLVPEAKARLIRNGLEQVMDPGFDTDAVREELGARGKPLVAAVSRLHRQKGLIYLLRAVPLLRKTIPDVMAVIAGGGPLKNKLARELRSLRIEDGVVLLGERTDARRIMAAADVVVLPSLWEGLPYVLIEAAALAKPIVASEIGGVKEVILNGETGLLVPPENSRMLADAVIRLLQDKPAAEKIGAAAKRDIPPRFAVQNMILDTERLYLEIHGKKAARPCEDPHL